MPLYIPSPHKLISRSFTVHQYLSSLEPSWLTRSPCLLTQARTVNQSFIMTVTFATRCPNEVVYDSDDDFEWETPTQSIAGRNIDPTKLKILLRTKFGVGSFEIQIIQNTYCINAPRKLSTVSCAQRESLLFITDHSKCEIARCRRKAAS
jgi:hypothetical protein